MRGRQVCWSDPELKRLAEAFVPATDEVWRLHNRDELDCRFFQGFCEEGHYGGRSRPTSTRQGIYCCTPAGRFLASTNTVDPKRMARMLEEALAAWERVPESERRLSYDPQTRTKQIRRRERQFPEDGLALRVFSRDMPRDGVPDDWRKSAWNVDSLWFRRTEAAALLPPKPKPGAEQAWPSELAQRLVRHNLVDNVRGQTNGYAAAHVQQAQLTTRVERIDKHRVHVSIRGASRATTSGTWPKDGKRGDVSEHGPWTRGVKTSLRGEAIFDTQRGRFVHFELAALGTRFGRTRYNFRDDDVDEAPIAFAAVLDEDDPGRRVAPAEMGAYGW